MAGAFNFGYKIADTSYYYDITPELISHGSLEDKTLAQTNYLNYNFIQDIEAIEARLFASDRKSIRKFIKNNREYILAEFLAKFKQFKTDYGYSRAKDEYLVFCSDATLTYKDKTLQFWLENSFDNPNTVYCSDDTAQATKKINNVIDNYLRLEDYSLILTDREFSVREDLKYYVVDKKDNIIDTNFYSNEYETDTLNHTYAFTVINGKISCSKAFEGLFKNIDKESKRILNSDTYNVYCYVDENVKPKDVSSTYMSYINGALRVKKLNITTTAFGFVLLFLAAAALAVFVFVVCGKKLENGSIKLAWIDKIPSDFHLIASLLASYGLHTLIFTVIEEYIPNENAVNQELLYFAAVCLAALIWLIFIECGTSVIRVCKSEKKLYKNTVVYCILKYAVIAPAKKLFSLLKQMFTYKGENIKGLVIRVLTADLFINALLFTCIVYFAEDTPLLSCFAGVLMLILNIVLITSFIRYLKKLDTVISAAKNKAVYELEPEALPGSLNILASSLQYSKDELDAAVAKAVRDERLRTELITNVSHDLKTPLTSIINYAKLLETCNIQDENAVEYIDVLNEKGERLKRLIDDLVEASKITSGVITLNPVNLSLSELAAQAVYERMQEFSDNGLELVFKGDRTNVNAYADGNKTFRILDNLISNARKYSAKGSRVYCEVRQEEFSVFEIKNISYAPLDISPAELKERFVRGDKSRNLTEGSGLGLSIADNLCSAQGGRLDITIDGDLFKARVLLPREKPNLEAQ